jgi:hypothetical protein
LNPSQNECTALTLLGCDRVIIWSGKRPREDFEYAIQAQDQLKQTNQQKNQQTSRTTTTQTLTES